MKKKLALLTLMGSTTLVLSACTSNEIGVSEYNASPQVTVVPVQQNKEAQPESVEMLSESKEIIPVEVTTESSSEIRSVEPLEEVEEEEIPEVIEPAIEEQDFTHYDVQNATIEDERIQRALTKTIDYLKVNNQFFDTAEYHFHISEGLEVDTFIIEVSQRRADGLDMIGRYAYNYATKSLDPFYK